MRRRQLLAATLAGKFKCGHVNVGDVLRTAAQGDGDEARSIASPTM